MRAGIIAALVASVAAVPFSRADASNDALTDTDCEVVYVTAEPETFSSPAVIATTAVSSDVTVDPIDATTDALAETSPSSVATAPGTQRPHHPHGPQKHRGPRGGRGPWNKPSSPSTAEPTDISSIEITTSAIPIDSAPVPSNTMASETTAADSTTAVESTNMAGSMPSSAPDSYPEPSTVVSTTAAPASSPSEAPAGSTPFPYPSGSVDMGGWMATYGAPTETTWAKAPINSDAHSTSYTWTGQDQIATSTSTLEPACTAAASDYIQETLDGHNAYRASHATNPLIWDDSLACIAQRQADSCIFSHLTYVNEGEYGQNIAMGGGLNMTSSIDMWTMGEEASFQNEWGKANPEGDFEKYGHLTQVLWAVTTSVGCGTKSCDDGDFVVCNYFGQGNMNGMYGVMVLPASSGSGSGSDSGSDSGSGYES